jgi:hypothetical protein
MSYDYKYILLVLVEIGFFTGFLYINTHCISGFLSLNTNTSRGKMDIPNTCKNIDKY